MLKRKRLALISLHFAEYSVSLATALSKEWDVFLVLRTDNAEDELGNDWRRRVEEYGIVVLSINKSSTIVDIIKSAYYIVRFIRRSKAKVIHCQESYHDALILAIPFFPKGKNILTIHDPEMHLGERNKIRKFTRIMFYRRIIRRWASTVITHGELMVKITEKICPWLRNRVKSVAHGPLGLWNDYRSNIKYPIENKVLFFGRMQEYKGLGVFVNAVSSLKEKGLNITGVVAGKGPDLIKYKAFMEKAGCFEIHERYIVSSELSYFFHNALVIVLPYIDGTQSGVAAMALGFGRPVVASDVGSISELVHDGVNGFVVKSANASKIAESIKAIVCDNILAERLSSGACKLRDGALSWTCIATKTALIYEK